MTLDSVLRIKRDGRVDLYMSKVEIGQGVTTSIAQIAAEELDVPFDRIDVNPADTVRTQNGSTTAGSNSIQGLGETVRRVAAATRERMIGAAADRWGLTRADLEVVDGVVRDASGGRELTYGALVDSVRLNDEIPDQVTTKPPNRYALVGQPIPRPDIANKVFGIPSFVHDLRMPDMVHGRVLRPPTRDSTLEHLDREMAAALPGVIAAVVEGNFIGVVAEREEDAVRAIDRLREEARWRTDPATSDSRTIYERLLTHPSTGLLVVNGTPTDDAVPPIEDPDDAVATVSATYYRPYQMHGSLGPSAALVLADGDDLRVWSHTQGPWSLRGALAEVLGFDEDRIQVTHAEGAGCYGHNGADDVALDAALLARAVLGRPVMLKWMRDDEHRWEPYGSAAVVQSRGSLDQAGRVIDWNHDVYSYTHSGRPRRSPGQSTLLAARHLTDPLLPPEARPGGGSHGGIHRNADPYYNFGKRRVVKHFVKDSPMRVSALRGLGSFANVFAIESFMDELALAGGKDPVAFRLDHLDDERARAVIQTAAEKAGWELPRPERHGRGIGFARYKNEKTYVAVVADVSVGEDGLIRVARVTIAGDAGQIVNPDGLANQLEGGVVQATSWTLKESVRFGLGGVESVDWESYPVLSFLEAPEVETVLIDRPGEPSLGCGEATQGPTPAAIANAVYDAVGVRLREIPFTPERVRDAMEGKDS
jgi:CO/xanthine dehydrogenase Mo-binding subunit